MNMHNWINRCHIYFRGTNNKRKVKGKGNSIITKGAQLEGVHFDIIGGNNCINIGEGSYINNVHFFVRGSNHQITIGSKCYLHKGGVIWFEDNDCSLCIGDNTYIDEAHIALTEPFSSIEIGRDCMLSFGVDIRCGDSHSIIDLSTGKRINYAKDVKIGDHVWLGAYVQLLKGVTIGSDSVVAIRSVVTKDMPPNSMVAGIPAEIVKSNITWNRRGIYER